MDMLSHNLIECRSVEDVSVAAKYLGLDAAIVDEFNLPPLAGNSQLHHDRIVAALIEAIMNLGRSQVV
jgi:hypothetical protein